MNVALPPASLDTAEALNLECFCLSLDKQALSAALDSELGQPGLADMVAQRCPFMFAAQPVFVAERHMQRMAQVVRGVESVVALPAYRELVLATYASQFAKFGGESFETLSTRDLSDGTRLVNAKLTPGSGAPVNFDYVLREANGSWRIVNVVADGVSDLAIRASQYDKIYKASGYDGLIAQIKTQIEANRKGC